MLLETKWNYDDVEHVYFRAVSSEEDHHLTPFLNEDNIEEADIDKYQSEETNPQVSENPKAEETNADAHQERDEEYILDA